MPDNCIFCKIINDEIPGTKVYEDENVLAILDINPVNPGHILVFPKKHVPNFEEIEETSLVETIKAVKCLGLALKRGLNCQGYNIIENNDPIANQIIPHLHFHIIPRSENDNLKPWPQHQYEGIEEMNKLAEKIKNAL